MSQVKMQWHKAAVSWFGTAAQKNKTRKKQDMVPAITPKVFFVHTALTGSDWQALGLCRSSACDLLLYRTKQQQDVVPAVTPKVSAMHTDLTGSGWQAQGLLGKANCV